VTNRPTYREVDGSFGFVTRAVGRRLSGGMVGEPVLTAVEDEPSPAPRPDPASHFNQVAGGRVRRDNDVAGTARDEVTGLLDETQQIQRLTAHRQVPCQRPGLLHLSTSSSGSVQLSPNSSRPSVLIAGEQGGVKEERRVEPPNCFLNPPPTRCQIMYRGQLYTVYIRFISQFCSVSDRRKVLPAANFSQFQH